MTTAKNKAKASEMLQKLEQAETAQAVDTIFAEITKLPVKTRESFIALLDEVMISPLKEQMMFVENLQELNFIIQEMEGAKNGLGGLSDLFNSLSSTQDEADYERSKSLTHLMMNLNTLCGEKSDPFVKLYAQETQQMSDEDYNTQVGHMKLLLKVSTSYLKQLLESAPKPANPFRKGPGA